MQAIMYMNRSSFHTDNSGVLPNPGEIIFCDKDKDGNSSMTWSYSHPRVISLIQSAPIPFNVSGEEEGGDTKVSNIVKD